MKLAGDCWPWMSETRRNPPRTLTRLTKWRQAPLERTGQTMPMHWRLWRERRAGREDCHWRWTSPRDPSMKSSRLWRPTCWAHQRLVRPVTPSCLSGFLCIYVLVDEDELLLLYLHVCLAFSVFMYWLMKMNYYCCTFMSVWLSLYLCIGWWSKLLYMNLSSQWRALGVYTKTITLFVCLSVCLWLWIYLNSLLINSWLL